VEQIGFPGALSIAGSAPISVGDLVAVTVRVSHNATGTVEFLESVGAIVANIGTDYIEAYTPVTVLVPLSERDGVLKVSTIITAQPAVTSQGASVHRSSVWNTRGYTGDGIKVGVIDVGFSGYSALMGSELPSTVVARCYTAIGDYHLSVLSYCEVGDVHGTAVAEAIVDIAPDVTLYIANPISNGDIKSTAAWMVSEGVQVINMSMATRWDGPGDGTSPNSDSPLNTLDTAVDDGVMWVNAAGNFAKRSWYGAYSDGDSNQWLEFNSEYWWMSGSQYRRVYLSFGNNVTIQLRWDDGWDAANSNLDLYLYKRRLVSDCYYEEQWSMWGWVYVYVCDPSYYVFDLEASSKTVQDGSIGQTPIEDISHTVLASDYYYLWVSHVSGPAPEWFQLVVWGADVEIPISSYSITNPAESSNPGMLAVGAANWETPSNIESFSSRGPTMDGRIKPDIVGADRGDSVSYGVNGFDGTSQASPHVAGLAALVLERYPEYTPEQVATYLKNNALGGDTVPNNTWGYGLAQMPSFEPTAPIDVTATSGAGQSTVTWNAPLDDGGSTVTLYTVTSDPDGVTATTTGISVTVTGLANGTAYTFTVTATNSVGTGPSSDASNSVTPATVPGPPSGVSATPSDSQAVVSWTAPVSDGGSPITLYTVTSNPGGVTATTNGTSVTVAGLSNGTAYTFTTTATNSIGISSSSAPSSAVTPVGPPDAPTDVSAIPGDRKALVSWTAPASNGGSAITEYTVVSSPGGMTTTTTGASVTVIGLTNGTVYTFTVTATNSAGSSASSIQSTAVTAGLSPPVAYSQEVNTTAGVPVTITLTGSDVNGDRLGWAIILPVAGGTTNYVAMSQTTNTIDVVFTPNAGFIGSASFWFYATDGSAAGNPATININVSSAATPTPAPASAAATPTPIPNMWDAPSTSGWGLAALVAGMLAALVVFLTKIRPLTNARKGLSR
jgi:hypothetical protein